MDLDIPPHLDATRRLLSLSLRLRTDESPPAVPSSLLDDLNAQFAVRRVVIDSAPPRRSWFAVLRGFCATPVFGASALIALVLSVAVPALLQNSTTAPAENFRGLGAEIEHPARVFLVGGPAQIRANLIGSGDLEAESLMDVASLKDAKAMDGAKVIVLFDAGRIQSVDETGEIVFTSEIPADIGQLSMALARALSRL